MLRCGLVQVALLVALTTVLGTPRVPHAEASSALRLAQRIQAHHSEVKDMQARFVQTYSSGLLGREVVERGSLMVKRPHRMLWKYERPEEKVFVSDGKMSYFYVPADRQVVVRDATGDRGVALQILSGHSDLLAEFQVFAVDGSSDRVRLVPRRADAEVGEVVIEADGVGRVRWIEIVDLQGNRSSFRFEDVKENKGLSDRLFEFKVPAGVEVVSG
jgi:outer membrane lipoprotein carrier protein